MRRPAIVLIAIAALTLGSALPSVVNLAVAAEPAAVASGGTWGTAQKVPGLAALGALSGEVTSVSCASAGNCAAGGDYGDGRYLRAFVINEVNGIWSNALRVPGIDVLSGGRGAGVVSVSCAGPGNCAAAGSYMTSRGGLQGFVVSEVNGSWRRALAVPGLAALSGGATAEVRSVSCGAPGSCGAGGYYMTGNRRHGFVVSEVNGSWQKALQVPGLAALDKAGIAETMSVSCSAAGSCAAGGNYYNDGIGSGAFVVSASNGLWRTALPVRFASKVGIAQIWSVSCRRPGYCAAGGHYYFDGLGRNQAFVVSQVNGAWRKALEVPGSAVLNTGGVAEVLSVSCGGPTSCAAGGYYEDSATRTHPFVVNRVNGTWRAALQVPGLPATDNGGGVKSISCGVPGNCAAAGNYTDAAGNSQGFVVNEVNGAWRKAIDVPGLRALNLAGHAGVVSVSCGAADNCAAGGYYTDQIYSQAFIVGER